MVKQPILLHSSAAVVLLLVLIVFPVLTLSRRLYLFNSDVQYAVIFDAGSTGSRVHVFRFDRNLNLLKIGDDIEFYNDTEPGLSDYANDPTAAALSLLPLVEQARDVVPGNMRANTPLRLGATAGLRMLEGDAAENILEAVRDLLEESSFLFRADWVSILDGYYEGSYIWVTTNYLLGTLGEEYSKTVATIDLGGGSVQMAYAISAEAAANAPIPSNGEDVYVQDMYLGGKDYSVYAHSYLDYGLNAARSRNLAFSRNSTNPCVATGYDGWYEYDGVLYRAKADHTGASPKKCRKLVQRLLNLAAPCNYGDCSFNGAWTGGGGSGRKTIYVASSLYYVARDAGFFDWDAKLATIRPVDYLKASKIACATRFEDVKSLFPESREEDLPFWCMDLNYVYTLLVEGFGLHPSQNITAVMEIEYQNVAVDVSWPLGGAIDLVSALDKVASQRVISLTDAAASSI